MLAQLSQNKTSIEIDGQFETKYERKGSRFTDMKNYVFTRRLKNAHALKYLII